MPIRIIFLDIGQVLVGLDWQRVLHQIKPWTALSLEELARRANGNPDFDLYETGKISTADFFGRVSNLLELKEIPLETFKEIWGTLFVPGHLISIDFLHKLKERYRLIALSNTNEMHFEYLLKAFPIINELHDYVLSYRVGAMKPDALIYRMALFKAGCEPHEAIFVDDRPENVEGARETGIPALLFENEDQLKDSLRHLGLPM